MTVLRTLCLRLAALTAPALLSSGVEAATATATFQVQITIVDACSIASANNVDFGSQGSLALGASATATLSVNCTLLLPYSVGLNAGTGSGATIATRKMTGPGAAIVDYSLYRDITHLLVWGNTPGTNTQGGLGLGVAVPYVVYGFVPAQTTPAAGLYSDTITVTVTY